MNATIKKPNKKINEISLSNSVWKKTLIVATVPTKLAICAVRLGVNICTPFLCGALRKHSQRLQIEWSELFQCALIDISIRGTYPMYLFTLKLFVIQSHSLFVSGTAYSRLRMGTDSLGVDQVIR